MSVRAEVSDRWYRVGSVVLSVVVKGVYRTRVAGAAHIPRTGPVLVVSNHVSQKDPLFVGVAAIPRRRLHYMAKSELFRVPLVGRAIAALGAFPVVRGASDRGAMRAARDVLTRGDALLMFPEGTRSRNGRLGPGLSGAGSLGLVPGVVVVPVAVWGTRRPLGPARVAFGPPVDLGDLPAGARGVRAQAAVGRMMAAIAELVPRVGGPAQSPSGALEP